MGPIKQTNTFIGGMNTDLDYSVIKNNQYMYAENIRLLANTDNSFSAIQNIEGFSNIDSSVPTGETIVHTKTVRDYGIVFTVNSSNNNNVYRFDFSESKLYPQVTKIINNVNLGISKSSNGVWAITSVCRWEDVNNVKIYWADGKNQIKMIYVDPDHDSYNSTLTSDDIYIVPKCHLPQLEFQGFGSGSLKSGMIQYCYQLFNAYGPETSISPLSKLIHLTRTNLSSSSSDVSGSAKETNSTRSVKLKATLSDNRFERAKIISIYYPSNDTTTIPTISIIDDIEVTNNQLIYEDVGGHFISEMTIDEFNALVSYPMIPEAIESKDNMLFAGNITEDTWDIPESYDTRAYRADSSGTVLLTSITGQDDIKFNISNIESTNVPKNHDCVCPYNLDFNSDYMYGKTGDVLVYGGNGINIDYEIVVTDLIEDEDESSVDGASENWKLNVNSIDNSNFYIYRISTSTSGNRASIDNINIVSNNVIPNYSNAEVDSKLKGYQRSEVYRFGIVFYNDTMQPSPVHWIADIRMPKALDKNCQLFDRNTSFTSPDISKIGVALVTHPMGIRFKVKNIPTGVKGFEIVRCERTVSDRTVLMQGIVSEVIQHKDESNTLVALPYLSYSTLHGVVSVTSEYSYGWQFSDYKATGHYMFISPEICFNQDNAQDILDRATSISQVCRLHSLINPSIGDGSFPNSDTANYEGTLQKPLANAASVKYDGKNIQSVTNLDYNKNNGWAYSTANVFIMDKDDAGSAEAKTIRNAIRMDGGDFYGATLAKYYESSDISGNFNSVEIIHAKVAHNNEPFDVQDDRWKTLGVNIGDKTFYNWMFDAFDTEVTEDANNLRKMGPHGPCAILNVPDMENTIRPIGYAPETAPSPKDANAVVLCNIMQAATPYGGYSYATRQNSTYISTGSFVSVDGGNQYIKCVFGGDVYIGIMDYANGMFLFSIDDYEAQRTNRIYNGAYFPCETTVNLSLRASSSSTGKTTLSNGYSNHFAQTDVSTIGDVYSQSEPLYAYNDAYSSDGNVKKFVASGIYDVQNRTVDSRVMNSQAKTDNEIIDSWSKFKVANYIDVDNRYGSINHLYNFNNKLYFWQTDAFGVLSVNERSLIQDNNIGQLTLGTGGILTRFDYITTANGLKSNQQRAVNNSESTLYWYDSLRNEICAFGSSMYAVSKLKGVQSYLNDKNVDFVNDPVTEYDKKYNEVLFTLEGKTLTFNEQVGVFTSFYTYKPDYYFHFTDGLYLFNANKLYKYNFEDTANLINDTDKVSVIKFVVNDNYTQTKTFDNVEYAGDFTYETNFDDISFETKRQTSYTVTKDDIDYREDTYMFCIPRNSLELNEVEQLVNKSYKDRMKGKYLICTYKYDCNDGNTFKVPYISTIYRNSLI